MTETGGPPADFNLLDKQAVTFGSSKSMDATEIFTACSISPNIFGIQEPSAKTSTDDGGPCSAGEGRPGEVNGGMAAWEAAAEPGRPACRPSAVPDLMRTCLGTRSRNQTGPTLAPGTLPKACPRVNSGSHFSAAIRAPIPGGRVPHKSTPAKPAATAMRPAPPFFAAGARAVDRYGPATPVASQGALLARVHHT